MSRDARLFFIGLWNQCDDKGVFEWKPVGLRMRIFPADPMNVVPLLEELERADLIRGYETDDRRYGVVRNFVIFQRPKRPNNVYPLPNSLRTFNGMTRKNGEHAPNEGGNGRTEEGGRRKEGVPPNARVGPPKSRKQKTSNKPQTPFRDGFSEGVAETFEEAANGKPTTGSRVVPISRRSDRGEH